MTMKKFDKIEQFRDVIRAVNKYVPDCKPTKFVGTVKVHGTNAGINLDMKNDKIIYQSRNRVLTIDNDNAGFATWASQYEKEWKEYAYFLWNEYEDIHEVNTVSSPENIVIYGEWFGSSIQKGVGVSGLKEKHFMIFEVAFVFADFTITLLPMEIYLNENTCNIHNLHLSTDFAIYEVVVDWKNPHQAQNVFVSLTEQVEENCPVAYELDSPGIGEGIVWTAKIEGHVNRFKTKGEKHSASKVKTIAAVDVEKFTKTQEFVNNAVTENRLKQGLDYLLEMGLEINAKNTGVFVKWVSDDVIAEERETIVENQLDGKAIRKEVSRRAALWYKDAF